MAGLARFPDNFFDLAIVDPPYGLREHGGKYRGHMVKQKNGSKLYGRGAVHERKNWDACPPPPAYFNELFRVSNHQIIWGCNYFDIAFGPGRIVWDKCNDGSDQSGAEIAYNSQGNKVDLFRFMWRGMQQGKSIREGHIQQGNKKLNEKRIHPTQKPAALYSWCLDRYAQRGWKILDTHSGSQSSRVAAFDLDLDYWGWEIDLDYFSDGCRRFKEHSVQLRM